MSNILDSWHCDNFLYVVEICIIIIEYNYNYNFCLKRQIKRTKINLNIIFDLLNAKFRFTHLIHFTNNNNIDKIAEIQLEIIPQIQQ